MARIYQQLEKAMEAVEKPLQHPEFSSTCTGAFTQQFGLPCAHYIYRLLLTKTRKGAEKEPFASGPPKEAWRNCLRGVWVVEESLQTARAAEMLGIASHETYGVGIGPTSKTLLLWNAQI